MGSRSIIQLAAVSLTVLTGCTAGSNREPTPAMQALGIAACAPPQIAAPAKLPKPAGTVAWAPSAPQYPYPSNDADRVKLEAYADCLSGALTQYIRAWRAGDVPAQLPDALIPWGANRSDFATFTLRDPASMTAQEQWVVRSAHKVDQQALYGSFPDPNATYIVAPALLAPFGSTLTVEGQFPKARYFSAQAIPSFDLDTYRYDQGIGVGEVPLVDVDIDPLPGHVNPFRVGADRTATRRNYRIQLDMTKGNPVAQNPSFRPPHFRGGGNRANATGIVFEGPWGHPQSDGHKRGLFAAGQLWLRYYAPDNGTGPLAGVPLPKMSYQLDTGETFFIEPDLDGITRRSEQRSSIGRDGAAAPEKRRFMTEEFGWVKQAGIFESIIGGIAIGTGAEGRDYVNDLVRGVAARGDNIPAPGNYEQSATSAVHIDYLVRSMALERDHVAVLTGRLPTFPNTRGGASRMTRAQMRYWSITGYHVPNGLDFFAALLSDRPQGLASQSIMDDELVLDGGRNYVIVYSRDNERPSNAVESAGVNWLDWGASAEISWTLRWMSVGPEWKAPFAPTPQNLGNRADYWSSDFNPNATFGNTHRGELGPYQPRVQYMTRAEFEALGTNVGARLRADIPR